MFRISSTIKMVRLQRIATAMMFVIIGLLLNSDVQARPRLNVGFGGFSGSECLPEQYNTLLAGSQCEIVLTLIGEHSDTTYRGLPTEPPAGLVFNVRLGTDESNSSSHSQKLIERLRPEFFVSYYQALMDSFHQQGIRLSHLNKRPKYHFLITIPDDIAGQRLCISAAIDDPQYGHLEGADCMEIVAPCTQEDRNHILGTYVCFAFQSRAYERAITLADSLLQTGWHWWFGLNQARMAARVSGRYDRELEYTDIVYRSYGRVTSAGPINPAAEEERYRELRAKIIELREQQQQQR